ncbi:MAG: NfeD family protein [Marinifilaceae bacterium]|jgi:membrane-bound ClpP family serine protease|nr:NfeD family protein [Marinifilaceae bacterium]
MTIYLIIISLIIFGLVLLLLEFLVIPGISVAAIGGILMISGGVYLAYNKLDTNTAHIILVSTIFLVALTCYYSLRAKTWDKLMLKTNIEAKIEYNKNKDINIGDEATTISRLCPMGNIKIKGQVIEAKSIDGFIDENKKVEIVSINSNQIIVKLK